MANDLGISFSPFGDANDPTNKRGGGSAPSPQEAIRILSLRRPSVVGANAPIPGVLLNAQGGGAFGGSGMNLEQLLQLLYGQRQGMGGTPAFPSPGGGSVSGYGAPPPSVIPSQPDSGPPPPSVQWETIPQPNPQMPSSPIYEPSNREDRTRA